ncbi:translocation/assembly module TamB domain-containing protein [Albimonas pacifica]|uniref:Autotransporter translocation and assembly factor TamB n=1 Tax=Albimonas pacifica TaxID=1114924 RepID=A0A1I3GNS0_9RHOB|nr:translocation/assembly module TamB [Albimonas pacifica]SFI24942.1 Autotransporter translocation and assembly factor TamB [Albimonas pacifica]
MRRALLPLLGPLALAGALLTASPAAAQFSLLGLQNSLVQFVLSQISVEGEFEITADGVQENEDGQTVLAGIKIADGEGVWFEARSAQLSWNARRILRGEVEITDIALTGMRILRAPTPPEVEVVEDSEIDQAGFDPFAWPRSPIAVRVESLRLVDAFVAEGVFAPQSLAFEATGAFVDEGQIQSLKLDIRRTDAVEGTIDLEYVRDFSDESLKLALNAQEAPGGLVAVMGGLPNTSASFVNVDASGPLVDWNLTLAAEVDEVIRVDGLAVIDAQAPVSVDAQLALVPGPELSDQARTALGERAELDLSVREDDDGVVRIETGAFNSPSIQASAVGTYTRANGEMDFDLSLVAGAVMSQVAEGVDFERIAFDGALKGVPEDFSASGALSLAGLATAPADIGEAALEVAATVQGQELTVTADGDATGVRLDRLGPDLMGDTRLDIRAVWGLESQVATLETLSIDSPLLSVSAQGTADVAQSTAALDYALSTPSLEPVAAAYDQVAGGRLDVSGRAEGPFSAIHLTGRAAAEDLTFQGEPYGEVAITHDVTAGETVAGNVAVEASGSRYGPAQVATDFTLDGDLLSVTNLTGAAMGATLAGRAEVDLAQTLVDGSLAVEVADLGAFSDLAGAPIAGSLRGDLDLTTPEGRQDLHLVGRADGLEGFDGALAFADLDVTVRDATGESVSAVFAIAAEDAVLRASGVEKATQKAAETTQEAGAESAADKAADAAADAAEEAADENPRADVARVQRLEVTGEATDLTGAPAVRATAVVTEATSPQFDARLARATVEADLQDLTGAPQGTVRLLAEDASGQGAGVQVLDVAVDGVNLIDDPAATAVGFATGVTAPGAAIERVDFDARGEDLLGEGRAEANLAARSITADGGVSVASLDASATAEGLTTGRSATLTATVGGVSAGGATVRSVQLDATAADLLGAPSATAKATASGIDAGGATIAQVSLDAEGSNLIEAPAGQATLVASTVDVAGAASLSRVTARANGDLSALTFSVEGQGATAEEEPIRLRIDGRGRLDSDPQTITLSTLSLDAGEVSIAQQGALTATLSGGTTAVRGLNVTLPGGGLTGEAALASNGARGNLTLAIGDLPALAAIVDAPVDSGSVNLSADFDTRPGSARARVNLQARELGFSNIAAGDGTLAADLDADWNGRTMSAEGVIRGPFGEDGVRVAATLPLRPAGMFPAPPPGAQIDASVVWQGRAEAIWPLLPLPDHVLTGELDVDLQVTGAIDAPQPTGRIRLIDGSYQHLEAGTILSDLQVRSSLREGGGLRVRLTATDGAGGPVEANVDLVGDRITATATTREAVLVRRDDVTAAVSTDIRVEGPTIAPAVTGEIRIDRAEVRLVNATPPSLPDLGEIEIKGEPPEKVEEEASGGPTLDLKIVAPGDIFVRGRGLTSEWQVDLAITGYAASPRITGLVSGVRGTLDFLGRDFDLARSDVRFLGGPEIDPQLDVVFEHEREDITGRIAVRGSASDPRLAFESVPALPEDEVLPRVIFGTNRQSLSAAQGIQLAAGVATLASGGEGTLGRVRSAVGLDVLAVDTDGDATAISAGQNIAEGVYVGVKQPVDGGATAVEVEIDVFDNVTVDAETSGEDGSSVGVNWKYDW